MQSSAYDSGTIPVTIVVAKGILILFYNMGNTQSFEHHVVL